MTRTLILALSATVFTACGGGDSDSDPVVDSDSDTQVEAPLVSIKGASNEVFLRTAGAEGLCVDAVDPSAALEGGDLNVLGQTTMKADGTYQVDNVDVSKAPLAIFIIVRDCGNEGTMVPSATGIAADSYVTAVAGDVLERDVLFVSKANADGLDASLAAVGSTKVLLSGTVLGFVLDKAGSPLGGATVSCVGCDEVYYVDGTSADGLLSTAGAKNTATAANIGMALIPDAPVAGYQAAADGLTFPNGLFGSIDGLVAITAWQAE
jgi:hypothetical protein